MANYAHSAQHVLSLPRALQEGSTVRTRLGSVDRGFPKICIPGSCEDKGCHGGGYALPELLELGEEHQHLLEVTQGPVLLCVGQNTPGLGRKAEGCRMPLPLPRCLVETSPQAWGNVKGLFVLLSGRQFQTIFIWYVSQIEYRDLICIGGLAGQHGSRRRCLQLESWRLGDGGIMMEGWRDERIDYRHECGGVQLCILMLDI